MAGEKYYLLVVVYAAHTFQKFEIPDQISCDVYASKFAIFYVLYRKTQSCFFNFSFRASTLYFPPNEWPLLVCVDKDQGSIH